MPQVYYVTPPPPSPKKLLRRDIRNVCLVLAAILVTMNLVAGLLLTVFVFASPEFQSIMLQMIQGSPASYQDLMSDDSYIQVVLDASQKFLGLTQLVAMVVALPWLLCLRGKKLFTHDLVAVNQKIKPLSIIKILILMVGVSCVTSLIQLALNPLFEQAGLSFSGALDESVTNMLSDPLGIAYIMLLGPIMEEIIFRGAVLNRLTRHGYNFAIVMSALFFGVYHMILIQGFNAFFLGVLLAYVALRYSIKWSMVLHALYNSLLVGFSLFEPWGPQAEIIFLVIMGLCLVASIVLLVFKRKGFPRTLQAGVPQTPRPFRAAFTSPFLLIFLVVLLSMGGFLLMFPG